MVSSPCFFATLFLSLASRASKQRALFEPLVHGVGEIMYVTLLLRVIYIVHMAGALYLLQAGRIS